MAISQAMCTSFKKELLEGKHNFLNSGGNTFKLALYTSSASLGAGTTAYTTSNEVSGTTALTDFTDLTFSNVTLTARGALIFNEDTTGDTSVCVLDFGADKSASSGDFTVVFPTADSSNAIIRIA